MRAGKSPHLHTACPVTSKYFALRKMAHVSKKRQEVVEGPELQRWHCSFAQSRTLQKTSPRKSHEAKKSQERLRTFL